MSADETPDREGARTRIFDSARTLAVCARRMRGSERWEPLRDLIAAGLQSGGFDHVADTAAVSAASGELAGATLDARRRLAGDQSGPLAGRLDAS